MAITNHPAFPQPNTDDFVWRYMDLPKLLDLFLTGSLWLCQAGKLGDPFEGSGTKADVEKAQAKVEELAKQGDSVVSAQRWMWHSNIYDHYISSWCRQAHEHEALWRLYAASGAGFALRCRYSDLASSTTDSDVYMGEVVYRNYETEIIPFENALHLIMSKRHQFAHEHEVRLVKWLSLRSGKPKMIDGKAVKGSDTGVPFSEYPLGVRVAVDLARLKPAIIMSPYTQPWVGEILNQCLARIGVTARAVPSEMNHGPYRPATPMGKAESQRYNDMIKRAIVTAAEVAPTTLTPPKPKE